MSEGKLGCVARSRWHLLHGSLSTTDGQAFSHGGQAWHQASVFLGGRGCDCVCQRAAHPGRVSAAAEEDGSARSDRDSWTGSAACRSYAVRRHLTPKSWRDCPDNERNDLATLLL